MMKSMIEMIGPSLLQNLALMLLYWLLHVYDVVFLAYLSWQLFRGTNQTPDVASQTNARSCSYGFCIDREVRIQVLLFICPSLSTVFKFSSCVDTDLYPQFNRFDPQCSTLESCDPLDSMWELHRENRAGSYLSFLEIKHWNAQFVGL